MVCPYSCRSLVVQAQVLGWPGLGGVGTRCGCWPRATVRHRSRSSPRSATASRPPPTGRWRRSLPTRPPPCGPRVLRDEVFDVIHVHEPLAPGPSLTTVTLHVAPTVGTFHAAGRSTSYRLLAPLLRRLLDRIDERAVVSKDALARAAPPRGERATTSPCSSTVSRRPPSAPPRRCRRHDRRSSSAGTKSARTGRAAPGISHARPRRVVLGGGRRPDTDRLRIDHAGDTRIEWLGRVDEAEKLARLRGARSCAPCRCTASRSASC